VTFERLLALNPNDNQGVRFCWADVRARRSWEEAQAEEERQDAQRRALHRHAAR